MVGSEVEASSTELSFDEHDGGFAEQYTFAEPLQPNNTYENKNLMLQTR